MTSSTRRGGPAAGFLLREPGDRSPRRSRGGTRVTCEVVPVAVITSGHCALQYRIRALAAAEAAVRQLRAHGLLARLATLPGERQPAARRAGHHSPAQFLIHHPA